MSVLGRVLAALLTRRPDDDEDEDQVDVLADTWRMFSDGMAFLGYDVLLERLRVWDVEHYRRMNVVALQTLLRGEGVPVALWQSEDGAVYEVVLRDDVERALMWREA